MTWDLIGHQWAANILQQHILSGSVRHAYLFTGPEHVGKHRLALQFAQAINCRETSVPGVPCGQCRSCTLIQSYRHPDLHVLEKEEGRTTVRIEQVRALQYSLSLAPYEAERRIALLPDFHEATYHAWNALLKTLEEPSDRVVLLLTSPSTDLLLPTIVSRCEVLSLRQVAPSVIEKALAHHEGDAAEIQSATRLAIGCPGLAISYLEGEALQQQYGYRDDFFEWLQAGTAERLRKAETWMNWRAGFPQRQSQVKALLEAWVVLWRDILQQKLRQTAAPIHLEVLPELQIITAALETTQVLDQITRIEQALEELLANADPRLLLENLVAGFPAIPILSHSE
ncbi:MAG: hypothetical protein JXA25_07960 [Anaerolineales bacterium]|nr:hypothetical protein [Anaerolineales bacterium]